MSAKTLTLFPSTRFPLGYKKQTYLLLQVNSYESDLDFRHTAILYRASTGPEQGFPCEVFHTGKNLFSLQGTLVLIAGTPVFITGISL